jgi:hypothetical protein
VVKGKKSIITKSKYMAGLRCMKYLWYIVNAGEEIPEPDFSTKFIFDQGLLVGQYAKKLFPDGKDMSIFRDPDIQIAKTLELLPQRHPIFEASSCSGNVYSRADILKPASGNRWDIIEVKSSTRLKEEYIYDVSFQKYSFMQAGIKIRRCFLALINNKYVRLGDINPEKLFDIHDITAEVGLAAKDVPGTVKYMLQMLEESEPPSVKIGRHCNNPYICPIKSKCWDFMPENHIFNLYGNKDRAADLYEKGILSIDDIPGGYDLSIKQKIQRDCAATKKPFVEKEKISDFLNSLRRPLYFFDFETYSTAIPIYNHTKPFQRIPFQYSIHMLESLEDKPVHYDFLASCNQDPRIELLKNLKKHLVKSGSIIVYYEFFEKGVLRELAEDFPEYGEWIETLFPRIVDLYRPFGNFYYYNSFQRGSASVKNVLPAMTSYSYSKMDIADGLSASAYFLYACGHYSAGGKQPSRVEIKKIRKDLVLYCRMDTGGMIHILRGLKEAVK